MIIEFDFFFLFFFISAGFAWILPGRRVNGFPSTGQILVWRKQRLLHIEVVSEWLSGHNQNLNSYTNPNVSTHTLPPSHTHPFTSTQPVPSQNFSPAVPKSHPRCLALFSSLCGSNTDPSGTAELKQKWNEKESQNATSDSLRACVLLVWVGHFSWLKKPLVWNYFLILAYL